LTLNLDEKCLRLITPRAQVETNKIDISFLYYKGMSLLRYGLEIHVDISTLESLLSIQNCSRELITLKDPVRGECFKTKKLIDFNIIHLYKQKDYLTPNEYAIKNQMNDYAKMIDKKTVDYILNSRHLRMQLALNGYDFSNNRLKFVRFFLLRLTIK
jgi:hypothetical protein